MSDWQPIETAPRDKTPFLALTKGGGHGVAVMGEDDEHPFLCKPDGRPFCLHATHWMPLPGPPNE